MMLVDRFRKRPRPTKEEVEAARIRREAEEAAALLREDGERIPDRTYIRDIVGCDVEFAKATGDLQGFRKRVAKVAANGMSTKHPAKQALLESRQRKFIHWPPTLGEAEEMLIVAKGQAEVLPLVHTLASPSGHVIDSQDTPSKE